VKPNRPAFTTAGCSAGKGMRLKERMLPPEQCWCCRTQSIRSTSGNLLLPFKRINACKWICRQGSRA